MKKIIAMLLALCMVFALCACGQPAAPAAEQPAAAETAAAAEDAAPAEDTVTVMVPPVSSTYQDDIDTWAAEFTEMHPNIKIEVIKTSWDDHNDKLSTMANAGEAPDIAEISYSNIGQYVDLGVDISAYMDADRLADYDQNAMDYMSIENVPYGLPLYITIQSIGGNREMLEAAARA